MLQKLCSCALEVQRTFVALHLALLTLQKLYSCALEAQRTFVALHLVLLMLQKLCSCALEAQKNICSSPPINSNAAKIAQFGKGVRKIWGALV